MARPKKNPLTMKLFCEGCKQEKEVKYTSKPRRFCSKKCAANCDEIKQKNRDGVKNTFIKKYGCHPMQLQNTKETLKNTMLKTYGVSHYSQISGFNDIIKQTKLKKYGCENYNNIEKRKATCVKKYGVDNVSLIDKVIEKRSQTKRLIHYNHILKVCEEFNVKFLCEFNDYIGHHFSNLYPFVCNVCNEKFNNSVYHFDFKCPKCHPQTSMKNEVYEYIKSILPPNEIILQNDTKLLSKKELNIYVPNKKVAIELNELYWHSEFSGGKTKLYHLNKTKICNCYGVKLIHIFENEWKYKQHIVKSILKNILSNPNHSFKITARECEIRLVKNEEKNTFLEENHLQGSDKSTIKIGLYYKNELMSIMTFRKKSRFDKNVQWELVRYCNKTNTIVVGGASKIFLHFIKKHNPKTIVSYSDRRYFSGNVYESLGFKFVSFTSPGYSYIDSTYKQIKNRMYFQKHKLSKILTTYDSKLSEWENMKNNGYDRIWDCGHSKWIWSYNSI